MQGPLTLVLQLLLIAAAVGLLAKRLRIHYNIALVLAGVVVGAVPAVPKVALDPEIVLQVFLPILLFEAAISTDLRRLRENLAPVLLLAVPGMLAQRGGGGSRAHAGLGLAWPLALLLGSILAATDTIAVIASFRKVRAPPAWPRSWRTTACSTTGPRWWRSPPSWRWSSAAGSIPCRACPSWPGWWSGASLIGLLVGYAASLSSSRRTEDHLIEIMLTVIATYGSSAARGDASTPRPCWRWWPRASRCGTAGWDGAHPHRAGGHPLGLGGGELRREQRGLPAHRPAGRLPVPAGGGARHRLGAARPHPRRGRPSSILTLAPLRLHEPARAPVAGSTCSSGAT